MTKQKLYKLSADKIPACSSSGISKISPTHKSVWGSVCVAPDVAQHSQHEMSNLQSLWKIYQIKNVFFGVSSNLNIGDISFFWDPAIKMLSANPQQNTSFDAELFLYTRFSDLLSTDAFQTKLSNLHLEMFFIFRRAVCVVFDRHYDKQYSEWNTYIQAVLSLCDVHWEVCVFSFFFFKLDLNLNSRNTVTKMIQPLASLSSCHIKCLGVTKQKKTKKTTHKAQVLNSSITDKCCLLQTVMENMVPKQLSDEYEGNINVTEVGDGR